VALPCSRTEHRLPVGETRSPCKFSMATAEVTMLHVLEPADRIDLTNGAKTCIFNPDPPCPGELPVYDTWIMHTISTRALVPVG
jgi:hypothetical protein